MKEQIGDLERLAILDNSIKMLIEMKNVQCLPGNWDESPYMRGMANGMIFALSLFEDKRPEYLGPPEVWGKDKPSEIKEKEQEPEEGSW